MAEFFVTAPKGCEQLLRDELIACGIHKPSPGSGGVSFSGELEQAYRVCLWSRVANRVLMSLGRFAAPTPEKLYDGVYRIDWSKHMRPEGSLAVDCFVRSSEITHSRYAALKVKDAIVDQFRDQTGRRPSVNLQWPDLRLNLYLYRNQARLSLDLSGDSLHRRGYREEAGPAPLKENLAATILQLADWPRMARDGCPFIDPMCGSGTLPIEAALMAADIAPGSLGREFGFERWLGYVPAIWQKLMDEAAERRRAGLARLPLIQASDRDEQAVELAQRNAQRAGLGDRIRFNRHEMEVLGAPTGQPPGLLLVNPPYGERLGDKDRLAELYRALGGLLRHAFPGWQAALFTGNPPLAQALRLRAHAVHDLNNGALPCKLFRYRVDPERMQQKRGKGKIELKPAIETEAEETVQPMAPGSDGAQMLVNRLGKNLKRLGRWARRNQVSCYRLYDADLPEYAVAVDVYAAEQTWAVVQEYAPPLSIEPALARTRLAESLGAVQQVLELDPEQLVLKTRRRQKSGGQYERLGGEGHMHQVAEGGLGFWVNFTDYLDTGLFLDHRLTRELVRELARGRDFLNLFAYTGSVSVYAAAGGAGRTTSVDMSRTYLDWAQRNLALNGFTGEAHETVQADCVEWLAQQSERPRKRYGLIFLDPPTHSRSKRMQGDFDVQRDHVQMIRQAMRLLQHDGVLIFSNNYRRFRLDAKALEEFELKDISAATIPEDFKRKQKIHRCWRIEHAKDEKPSGSVWPSAPPKKN